MKVDNLLQMERISQLGVSLGNSDRRNKLPDEVAPDTGEPDAALRRVSL
jgi:hypothetical protein